MGVGERICGGVRVQPGAGVSRRLRVGTMCDMADGTVAVTARPSHDRLLALDAARGFALLGIFLVNIQFFAAPIGEVLEFRPPAGGSIAEAALWWFNKVLCEGKFYPMFSLLFGMGLVLLSRRIRGAGRRFWPIYLRRLVVLGALGIAHIVLLWYGDVLLVYSVCGVVLLIGSRLGARWLLVVAAVFLAIAMLMACAGEALEASDPAGAKPDGAAGVDAPPSETAEAGAPASEFSRTPVGRLLRGFADGQVRGPEHPLWVAAEVGAFRDGPYSQAVLMRLISYAGFTTEMLFGFAWHVLAMFFLGAALLKLRLFDADRGEWRGRLIRLGMAVGLPLCAAAVALPVVVGGTWARLVAAPLSLVGSPMVGLAYLLAIAVIAERRPGSRIILALANAGRMALTVYLCESLITSAVMSGWGLARFGGFDRLQRFAYVVGVYAVLVLAAGAWMRFFSFGPLEWLWRTATYLRVPRRDRTVAP